MKHQHILLTSVSLAVMAMVHPAAAQVSGNEADANTIEMIVVTGQKREENIQDVPVSVVALAGDALKGKAVERLDDLQFAAPGLSITDAGLTQSVNIRGIGLASGSPNVSNGVATYVDGVFQPPIVTTNSFYDIQSAEVYRGPQGTFVGSNSTGGAIFINSHNPILNEFGGYAEGTIGNYDLFGIEGAINIPVISDKLAVRGAFIHRNRDSYYQSIGPVATKAGSLDEISGRIGILATPNDVITSITKLEIGDKESGGYAYRPIPGTLYAPYRTSDIRLLDYDDPTQNHEKSFQVTENLSFELAGGTVIKSISGYQNKRIQNLYDSDATSEASLPQANSNQFVQEKVYTQEVNVISPTDGAFSWIVGSYFQRNRITVDITQRADGFPTDIDIGNRKTTWGWFGQGSYEFSPEFSVDVGARYSTFDITGDGAVAIGRGIPGFPADGRVVADPGGAHNDGRVTGKVNLNWRPSPDQLFYAFVARGYKSGGFSSPTAEFKPETVMDYELGWKGSLMDGQLVTQLDAFYSDYNNFQFDVLEPSVGRSGPTNLTGAKIKGVEAQIFANIDDLRIDAGLAYVDSSLSGVNFVDVRAFSRAFPGVNTAPQCPAGQPSSPPACIDYTPFYKSTGGGPNLYAPKWTFNIGAEYSFQLSRITFTPRVNYAYVSDRWAYIGYDPVSDLLAGRGVLSALATFELDRYRVQFYGRNLTDNEYVTGQSGNNEFYGAPREYGVRIRVEL